MSLPDNLRREYDKALNELIELAQNSARNWQRDDPLQAVAPHEYASCTAQAAIQQLNAALMAFGQLRISVGFYAAARPDYPEPTVTPDHILIMSLLRRECMLVMAGKTKYQALYMFPPDFWKAAAQFIDSYIGYALDEIYPV